MELYVSWLEPIGRAVSPWFPFVTAKNAEAAIVIGNTLAGTGLFALAVIGVIRGRKKA